MSEIETQLEQESQVTNNTQIQNPECGIRRNPGRCRRSAAAYLVAQKRVVVRYFASSVLSVYPDCCSIPICHRVGGRQDNSTTHDSNIVLLAHPTLLLHLICIYSLPLTTTHYNYYNYHNPLTQINHDPRLRHTDII